MKRTNLTERVRECIESCKLEVRYSEDYLDASECIAVGKLVDGRPYQIQLKITVDSDDFCETGYGEIQLPGDKP